MAKTAKLVMPAVDLRRVVKAVAIAASTDDCRPLLTGVLIEITADRCRIVATDSYRLHMATLNLAEIGHAAPMRATVPAGFLQRWAKSPMAKVSHVELSVAGKRVTLTTDGLESMSTLLLDEAKKPYPDVDNLFKLVPEEDEGQTALAVDTFPGVFAAAKAWREKYEPIRVLSLTPMKPCHFSVVSHLGTLDMLVMPTRVP